MRAVLLRVRVVPLAAARARAPQAREEAGFDPPDGSPEAETCRRCPLLTW